MRDRVRSITPCAASPARTPPNITDRHGRWCPHHKKGDNRRTAGPRVHDPKQDHERRRQEGNVCQQVAQLGWYAAAIRSGGAVRRAPLELVKRGFFINSKVLEEENEEAEKEGGR